MINPNKTEVQLVKAELIYESERLNCYKDTLQLAAEYFDILFWVVVLRAHNEEENAQEILASSLYPCEGLRENGKMEILSTTFLSNNLGNL